ncbi:MAG: hypothetical protein ACM336_04885 [Acidobacteriota bacterium]
MQRFHFRLGSVLGWRALQLELERGKLETLLAGRKRIAQDLARLAEVREASEKLLASDAVEGQDLAALDAHRYALARAAARLRASEAECDRDIARQRANVLEAERRVRLLERLKERRLAEWQAAVDRELEALASETFLAKWVRDRA